MTNRSAFASIKGYYYQFDKTILEILSLQNDDDSVVIEGIEDIDIITHDETRAIQCKYLESKSLVNSLIRKPIILMLNNFIERTINGNAPIRYKLFGYYKDTIESVSTPTLTELKDILTWREKTGNEYKTRNYQVENNISDNQLSNFLEQLLIQTGKKFEEQQDEIIAKIQEEYRCAEIEAELYYYNNALTKVINLAKEESEENRKISKKEFKQATDLKVALFNYWYILLRGREQYLRKLKANIKFCDALNSYKQKCLFIDTEIIDIDSVELPLVIFIENVINKYYQLEKVYYKNKPWTIIITLDENKISEVKKELIRKNIKFNDGLEHLEFSSNYFNAKPVIEVTKGGNRDKIKNASFVIKILSARTLKQNKNDIGNFDVIFLLSKQKPSFYFNLTQQTQLFSIVYLTNLKEVSTAIF